MINSNSMKMMKKTTYNQSQKRKKRRSMSNMTVKEADFAQVVGIETNSRRIMTKNMIVKVFAMK